MNVTISNSLRNIITIIPKFMLLVLVPPRIGTSKIYHIDLAIVNKFVSLMLTNKIILLNVLDGSSIANIGKLQSYIC